MQVNSVNPFYQNNRDWAITNNSKGRNATICAVSSTAIGCVKTFVEKDSFTNRVLDIGQKVLDGLRNKEQYTLYKREDDDLDYDKRNRPIAANLGTVACQVETNVNPIALPFSSLLPENVRESYSSICNWFSSMWWRARPASEKINWKCLKLLPLDLAGLFDAHLDQRRQSQRALTDNLSPFFGLMGCFCMGIFVPIRAWNKLKENENKWIDAAADGGLLSQHTYYFVKFTLDELFKAQETSNKNSWYLFGAGLAANTMNISLPLVDVLPLSEKTKTLWKEFSQGLARTFFSSRRNIKGNEWLEKNNC